MSQIVSSNLQGLQDLPDQMEMEPVAAAAAECWGQLTAEVEEPLRCYWVHYPGLLLVWHRHWQT